MSRCVPDISIPIPPYPSQRIFQRNVLINHFYIVFFGVFFRFCNSPFSLGVYASYFWNFFRPFFFNMPFYRSDVIFFKRKKSKVEMRNDHRHENETKNKQERRKKKKKKTWKNEVIHMSILFFFSLKWKCFFSNFF